MNLSIHPNPISSSGHLTIVSSEKQEVHVRVTDIKGKLITHKTASVEKGANVIHLYSYTWKAGLYFIQCRNEKGDHRQVKVLKIKKAKLQG